MTRQRGFIFGGLIGFIASAFMIYLFWKIILLGFLGVVFGGVPGGHNKLDADPSAGGVVIGFFNGVFTLPDEAKSHLISLKSRFGDKTPAGKPLQYQLFYNDSYGKILDLAETFDQRTTQIGLGDHYNFFWGLLTGDQSDISRAAVDISGAAETIDSMARLFSADTIEYLHALKRNKEIQTAIRITRLKLH